MLLDILLDAAGDCLKDLPFLFAAFLFLEALEHHTSDKMNRLLLKAGNLGPLAGAVLGCVPQCGFSIMAADFYSGGVVTLGTLLAVFLSTSDEAIVILLSNSGHLEDIGRLVLTKVVIGLIAGYIILAIGKIRERRHPHKHKGIEDLCHHCGCEHEEGGILKPALRHTGEVLLFLFIFTFLINLLLEVIGLQKLSTILLADSLFQPVLAALIGLIPNCAASVVLTQLYLDGVISFGSAVSGLCSAAGLGLVVLWRVNHNKKENLFITLLLLAISIAAGMILM
ncbi:MAG: putative manganese transporter [Lachnospiraceae bacterium]|nr:putative manganese transporter [Lachnospiraceae bacterium]